jgi:ketosteroid isomerase-like protein
MSQENAGMLRGVRLPLRISSGTRPRTLSERILIRVPALFRALALFWSRLPTSSRLRRRLTRHNLQQTYEAANRRDFEVLVLRMHPELEFRFEETPLRSMAPPDLVGVHHGPDAYVRVWRAGIEISDDYRVEPEEVIDLGDRLLVVGRQRGHGTGSGIPFDEPLLTLFALRDGLVIRLEDFAGRESALEAAGLSE